MAPNRRRADRGLHRDAEVGGRGGRLTGTYPFEILCSVGRDDECRPLPPRAAARSRTRDGARNGLGWDGEFVIAPGQRLRLHFGVGHGCGEVGVRRSPATPLSPAAAAPPPGANPRRWCERRSSSPRRPNAWEQQVLGPSSATRLTTSCRRRTSVAAATARPPVATMRATSASSRSSRRAPRTTVAPRAAWSAPPPRATPGAIASHLCEARTAPVRAAPPTPVPH